MPSTERFPQFRFGNHFPMSNSSSSQQSDTTGSQEAIIESFRFEGSLKGRLQRIRLLENQAILPIYEAISNAFQSIKETGEGGGIIEIRVERAPEGELIKEGPVPIRTVTFIDNGIGFDDDNFRSFRTPDSMHKYHLGAKGIGRLLWLKAFEKAEIESVFSSMGQLFRRCFSYVQDDENPVRDHTNVAAAPSARRQTKIVLRNLQEPYFSKFHPPPEIVAGRILQRFMLHFLDPNCPTVTYRDEGCEPFVLNQMLLDERVKEIDTKEVLVRNHALSARFVQMTTGGKRKHSIHLCAGGSEVEKVDIEKHVDHFPKSIPDSEGNQFRLAVYVTGDFLTNAANEQRTAFNLPKGEDVIDPTTDEVFERVCNVVREKYQSLLDGEACRMESRVRAFITNKRPVYRGVLPSIKKHLPELSKCGSDDELDYALNHLVRETELESEKVFEKYRQPAAKLGSEALQQLLHNVNEASSVRLAQYVARRRAVLFVLKRLIERRSDGSVALEDDIHDLVSPMRTTSDEVPTDRWNLWLLDEGLSFHQYLASDKPLKTMPLETKSGNEPDLLVMENPGAFTATMESCYDTITIVEFKRPLREDVGTGELPHQQVRRYIDKIQEEQKEDKNGRPIRTAKLTRFFCYLVCDFTKQLKKSLRGDGFTATPDDLSFFRTVSAPEDNRVVHYEYVSFDRMLTVAEKRNQVLFDKLGIVPDPIIYTDGTADAAGESA